MYSYHMTRTGLTPRERDRGARLARALGVARANRGLSGGQLSAASGVSVDSIRSIESGRIVSPGFALVASLGRAMDLSLDTLADQILDELSRA